MPKDMFLWACVRVTIVTDLLRKQFVKLLMAAMVANPVLAYADGVAAAGGGNDIAGMADAGAEGAKSGMKSALIFAQLAGLIFVIGGLIAAKNKKGNPQITVGHIVGSILFGACLLAVPEIIKRSQFQVGLTPVSVG